MKYIFTLILATLFCHFSASSTPAASNYAQMRSNLYVVNSDNSTYLMDGTLTQYDSSYSNDVNGGDALKLYNSSENFGMLRGSTVLIVERRHTIEGNDSIFFKMWNMRITNYKLELVAYNLYQPGRIGLLQDNYLHTSTSLNLTDTTLFNFTVTSDPASKASDRFRIVFITSSYGVMPLTFTSVKGFKQNNNVEIKWNTANEINVNQYSVQRSGADYHFTPSAVIKANNSASGEYKWIDAGPMEGDNYYRISSTDMDGKIRYSSIVKVNITKQNQDISVYPNPATGANLKLQMINQPPGLYEIKLINLFGQPVMAKTLAHAAGTGVENLPPLFNIPKGIYRLEIKTPSGGKKLINVLF
jgi:hypothetical protein